jgi:hypothetical protein
MKSKFLRWLAVFFIMALAITPVLSFPAEAEASTILSEGFESGTGNWTLDSGIGTTTAQAHGGSFSLSMNVTGSAYHKFTPAEIASPFRDVTLYWYPVATSSAFNTAIMSFEEGSFTVTNKSIEAFWGGSANVVYFKLYTYAGNVTTSTTTSANVTITNDAWHKFEFTSNTTATQIKVDDVAVTFGGVDHSTTLTNTYDWLRFSASSGSGIPETQTIQIASSNDDTTTYWNGSAWVSSTSNGFIYAGQTTGVEKMGAGLRFLSPTIQSGSTINSANMTIYVKTVASGVTVNSTITGDLELNPATFSTLADYQARRGTVVGGANDSKITTSHVHWDNISAWTPIGAAITTPEIGTVIQEIINQPGWNSGNAIALFLDDHVGSSTMNAYRMGQTYSGNATQAAKLNITYTAPIITYYVDDISVSITPIIDTSNLYSRTINATMPANPGGTNNIQLIYGYLIDRNPASLSTAQTAADLIQSAYNGGDKSLNFLKEIAILYKFDPTRLELLNNLADLTWTYRVNSTTKLPYKNINSAGVSTDNICMVADPLDALTIVNAFTGAYLATSNITMLNRAESILTAINTYMRHPTYDTIMYTVNATNGAQSDNRSRGGVSVASFIETAMYLSSVSGNISIRDMAENQAQKYIQYAWDSTVKAFTYRPDDIGFEDFTPEMSQALMYVYEATSNATYMTYAEDSFNSYMTYFRRNGLTCHYFYNNGQYGWEPSHFAYYIAAAAVKLYKHTGNTTYLAISDNYTSLLVDYFLGTNSEMIYSDNFSQYSSISYRSARLYQSELLYRFIMPTTGVTISWDYGHDLYGKYLSVANAPIDVSFNGTEVHLYNVSGTGNITFASGINTAVVHYGGIDYTVDVSSSHQVILPLGGGTVAPTVTLQAATTVEATTATLNANLTDYGGEACTVTFYIGLTDGGTNPASWSSNSTPTSPAQPQGNGAAYLTTLGLTAGRIYYFSASANNSGGTSWPAASLSFLLKPAAPTGVSASDGTSTSNVTISWTLSTGASTYHVWRDSTDLGSTGNVSSFVDTGAALPVITPGAASATDGTDNTTVTVTLSGTSVANGTSHVYKVVASNASGSSADSSTDTGYVGHGALTYQWQRSTGDAPSGFANLAGATGSSYSDNTTTPGLAFYWRCVLNATGATQDVSTADRGYAGTITPAPTSTTTTTIDLTAITAAIAGIRTTFADFFSSLLAFIPLLLLVGVAFWSKDPVFYIAGGLGMILFGFSYWTSNNYMSILLVLTGAAVFSKAFIGRRAKE